MGSIKLREENKNEFILASLLHKLANYDPLQLYVTLNICELTLTELESTCVIENLRYKNS